MIDATRLDRFIEVYGRHLLAAVTEDATARAEGKPSMHGYFYGPADVPGVVARMRKAFAENSYNISDATAIKRACRELKLKPTRKAINGYLAGEEHES